jgi:hypothetical protein
MASRGVKIDLINFFQSLEVMAMKFGNRARSIAERGERHMQEQGDQLESVYQERPELRPDAEPRECDSITIGHGNHAPAERASELIARVRAEARAEQSTPQSEAQELPEGW